MYVIVNDNAHIVYVMTKIWLKKYIITTLITFFKNLTKYNKKKKKKGRRKGGLKTELLKFTNNNMHPTQKGPEKKRSSVMLWIFCLIHLDTESSRGAFALIILYCYVRLIIFCRCQWSCWFHKACISSRLRPFVSGSIFATNIISNPQIIANRKNTPEPQRKCISFNCIAPG